MHKYISHHATPTTPPPAYIHSMYVYIRMHLHNFSRFMACLLRCCVVCVKMCVHAERMEIPVVTSTAKCANRKTSFATPFTHSLAHITILRGACISLSLCLGVPAKRALRSNTLKFAYTNTHFTHVREMLVVIVQKRECVLPHAFMI